ncbi:MAG: MBL fold metallo-hydrolase, partial [bacterium]|nr:MBL fold metallo-hydrolase [bacterium]
REIDMVIFTHPDSDHIGGLVETLKNYRAKIVGWSGVTSQQPLFQEFFNEANRAKSQKVILTEGYKIYVGKKLVLEVLSPTSDFIGKEVKDYNTSSLVLRVVYGQNEFMLTGDTSKSVEKKIANSEMEIASDVLKISHHGSSTASSDIFLERVKPELAVIQVGKDNKYGHPDPGVLERLEKYGIRILRTDQDGDIRLFSDGKNIDIVK